MKIALLALIALFGNQALATTAEPVNVVKITQEANLMPRIGGPSPKVATDIEIRVLSGGCTEAEDFEVRVKQTDDTQLLTIIRKKQDFCEAFLPDGEVVTLTTTRLKAKKPILVTNPLKVKENFVY